MVARTRSTRFQPALAAALTALLTGSCGVIEDLTQPSDLSIRRFTASRTDVTPGASVTLSWDVDGAETIEIDNGVGTVIEKGTRDLRPEYTTTFNLTARKGTSVATASVHVVVHSTDPTPTPSPTRTPGPSPTPTPSPSPTIAPAPSPKPSPSTTPSPAANCGGTAASASACPLTIAYASFASGECVAVNSVQVSAACPATFGSSRALSFSITARSASRTLSWRRAGSTTNVISPDAGPISGEGQTVVAINEFVLDGQTSIEIVDQSRVLGTVTIQSR